MLWGQAVIEVVDLTDASFAAKIRAWQSCFSLVMGHWSARTELRFSFFEKWRLDKEVAGLFVFLIN